MRESIPTPTKLTCMVQLESQARLRAQSKAHLMAALVLGHDHMSLLHIPVTSCVHEPNIRAAPSIVLKRCLSRRGLHFPSFLASRVSCGLVLFQRRGAEVMGHFLVGVWMK